MLHIYTHTTFSTQLLYFKENFTIQKTHHTAPLRVPACRRRRREGGREGEDSHHLPPKPYIDITLFITSYHTPLYRYTFTHTHTYTHTHTNIIIYYILILPTYTHITYIYYHITYIYSYPTSPYTTYFRLFFTHSSSPLLLHCFA